MARFGKPDTTGRSSGKLTGLDRREFGPPKGDLWVWLAREPISSDAWCARSNNCVLLNDFLLVAHWTYPRHSHAYLTRRQYYTWHNFQASCRHFEICKSRESEKAYLEARASFLQAWCS